MQPPTEPTPAALPQAPAARGDEDRLHRQHHRDLHRAVARAVRAPREFIEDACQTAWAILLRTQPERYAIFACCASWPSTRPTASRPSIAARSTSSASTSTSTTGKSSSQIRTRSTTPTRRLRPCALAALPERHRSDLTLKVAGHSYDEIRALTLGRTFTNLNKSLVKARAGIRRARDPRR